MSKERRNAKEILENLIDALIEAEPILFDSIRPLLRKCLEKRSEIERLAEELAS